MGLQFLSAFMFFAPLLCGTYGHPTVLPGVRVTSDPIDNGFMISSSWGNFTAQTRYVYRGCNSMEQGLLWDAVIGAATIAYAGLTVVNLSGNSVDFAVDFNTQSAIEYFGPTSHNQDQQQWIRSKYTVLILDDQGRRLYRTSSHEKVALPRQLPAQDIMLLRCFVGTLRSTRTTAGNITNSDRYSRSSRACSARLGSFRFVV